MWLYSLEIISNVVVNDYKHITYYLQWLQPHYLLSPMITSTLLIISNDYNHITYYLQWLQPHYLLSPMITTTLLIISNDYNHIMWLYSLEIKSNVVVFIGDNK
jgi:hypothetical protein